jgi:hypothetical protein
MVKQPLFSSGETFITHKARQVCRTNQVDYCKYLARHCSGEWGEVGNYSEIKLSETELHTGIIEDTGKFNVWLLKCRENGSIMSSYLLDDKTKLWIITVCDFYRNKNW